MTNDETIRTQHFVIRHPSFVILISPPPAVGGYKGMDAAAVRM